MPFESAARHQWATTNAGRTSFRVVPPRRQSYVQQYRQADAKKRGFVQLKDLQQPQYQMLRTAFDFIDANDDGKITEQEVTAFSDLLSGASMSFVTFANTVGRT